MPIATPRSVLVTEAVKGIVQRVNSLDQVAKALISGVKLSDRSVANAPEIEVTAAEIRAAIPSEDLAKLDALIAFYQKQ